MEALKLTVVWSLVKTLYAQILRGIIIKAVDDPDEVWDDWLMKLCDNLFEYSP